MHHPMPLSRSSGFFVFVMNVLFISARIGCLDINRLSYRRPPFLPKRIHYLIECFGELLDALVFELLRGRVQINPHIR